MRIDDETCYRALAARDSRFDGLFFVGVTTTGIYCRPICTARTPGRDRCRFFPNSAMAERDGFRPCLRCRPELAPGLAPVDSVTRVARAAASRIEAGALNGEGSLEKLARDLKLSSRQLRRAIRQEFGVSPVELAQTQRLLLAKQLLGESNLPIIEVAYASGFASVRRFNALFQAHYRLTPSRMRRAAGASRSNGRLRLTLGYRPPLAWDVLLRFLRDRATAGVEWTSGRAYCRTALIEGLAGWIKVEPIVGRNALAVELATSLLPVLPEVLTRLKHQFDLSARPDVIGAQLATEPRMKRAVGQYPGLRVPGAFDGFELAVRAILGQRISVRAATTLAGRIAASFGEPIETPFPSLNRLSPTAERLTSARAAELTGLGLSAAQAGCIHALAQAVASRQVDLQPGHDPELVIPALCELPGIGDWTAQYIAMRALRWPDAFPAGDLGLLKALGATSPRRLRELAAAWRPWRAYAAMYLWQCHDLDQREN
jgi:AraC family transcriptional regulator of adaptative response / DNA-3-methyladenine glycosylase II